jgi:iron-sulfur cluster repair protein YtfE (RIC family)
MLYLQTFEELTTNQSNIEMIIKDVLEQTIDEKDAIEKITVAVEYAEKLQKGFSNKMRENLNNLLAIFPKAEAETDDISSIKVELEKIYTEMDNGVTQFVEKVKELYKV